MISLLDARHVLVFGENCLFQEVLDRFGIKNAWHGEAAFWGSITVGIDRLAELKKPMLSVSIMATIGRWPN